MISKLFITIFLSAFALVSPAFAGDTDADRLIGYKWQPVLLSSYKSGQAPEVQANLNAFAALVAAEKASGEGKYLPDIINGFWFYATAHTWSLPSETGGKLPPREGQAPTPTSLATADILIDAWKLFSQKINKDLPILEPSLDATMKRISGKNLK